jgi:hypothetical protein
MSKSASVGLRDIRDAYRLVESGFQPVTNRLQHVSGRLVTYARSELVADRDWYRSVSFNEYRKLGG